MIPVTATKLYIGLGNKGIQVDSFKDGRKKAYDFIRDHPRTTAYINVSNKRYYWIIGRMYVDGKRTPVAWKHYKYYVLKSDGSLGKELVDSGRRITRNGHKYIDFTHKSK